MVSEERLKIELKVHEGLYVEKPEQWVNHRRSKNYIARIAGFDKQYGLKREFLEKEKVGRKTYFLLKDFIKGEVYEIKCIYYTNSGIACPELEGFFRCTEITKDKVVLEEISEEEVIRHVKENYSETEDIVKLQEQIEKLEKEKAEKIQTLQALEQVKATLQQEVESLLIDENEVKKIREELEKRILKIAENLLSLGKANNSYVVYSNKESKIVIKKEGEKIKYIKIKDVYVISEYYKSSLMTLAKAYKKLLDELLAKRECLKKIKDELASFNSFDSSEETDENKAFAGISASSNNNIINNINNTAEQENVFSSNFKKVKLVVFQLPSEYKGSKTKYQENGEGIQQVTVLKHDPAKFRTLRKLFYNKLHEVAWNSKIGWVLLSDADASVFSDIMKEFEKISGEKRVIEIIDIFLPKETVQVWLNDYISHVQQKVDLAKMKLENASEKEAKRYKKELVKLEELLSKLERELKNL